MQIPINIEKLATPLQNPLQKEEEKKDDLNFLYSSEDKNYLSFLQRRLEDSRNMKNTPLPEFNNKTYYQDFEENVKIAHTKLPEKKNEDDVILSAGTIEDKLNSLLSHVANLDLSPEVMAYDRENNQLNDLGIALTDTIFMTEQIDGGEIGGDEEKKLLRQRELLSQNAVFVQEEWLRKFERKKKLSAKYDGQFKDWKNWNDSLELCFEGPSRNLIYGPNVYLGDITEYSMEKQPYIFIAYQEHYDIAKTKYGKFENWVYVKAGKIPDSETNEQRTIYDMKFRLNPVRDNHVEIILYQDKPTDEFQILINGVCMLPIGFPLSAVSPSGEYNVVKQVFRVVNHKFAYGKPFVKSGSVYEIAGIVDEMLKLFVLKTRKSVAPPYANVSGRVISKKVLSPGRITMGISPDALKPIGTEGQGVTSNEYNILKELQDRIDKSTVSPQFQGQQGKSGTTATEVMELQRQAKQTLGLTIAACVLLEKKLGYLRLYNIIENWFNPFDTKVVTVDDVRKELKMYRNTTRQTNIEGEGMGERQVIPVESKDELPASKEIRNLELEEERRTGTPTRKIYLDYNTLKTAKIRWYIVITPKEKEGTAFFKILFREQLADMMVLMQLGSVPKLDGIEEEFSRVWGKSRGKLFGQRQPAPVMGEMSNIGEKPGASAKGMSPAGGVPNMAALGGVTS